MIVVGIDPGLKGALVALDNTFKVRRFEAAPKTWTRGSSYDDRAMCGAFVRFNELQPELVVLEEQHARPDEGVVSTFTTALGFGLWRGVTAYVVDRRMVVDPRRWQAVVHKGAPGANTKRRSLHVARERCGLDGNDHNVADACCIALYGLHLLGVW